MGIKRSAAAVLNEWANATEYRAYKALARLSIDFIPQHRIDRYIADAFLPKYNTVVEFDDPGHNYEPRYSRDRIRDEFMATLGYYTLRIPYKAMEHDTVRGIRDALESVGIPYSEHYGQCVLTIDEIVKIEARANMYLSGYVSAVGLLFPVFRHREIDM